MRKLLVATNAVLALAVAAPASAATVVVTITRAGFSPPSIQVTTGDIVTWTNNDTASHQVVADDGSFASPVLRAGQSYSFTFNAPGRFTYRDALGRNSRGAVTAKDPPPAVSIGASATQVVYGQEITLSGAVSSKRPGEQVMLLYRPYPQTSFLQRTVVITSTGGAWSFVAQPGVLTAYQASYKGVLSPEVTVEVRPQIILARSNGFVVKVRGGRSFAGREVKLQRLSALGQWITVKKVRLNTASAARFPYKFPRGRLTRLRIALSVNQAGGGFLGGFSPTLNWRPPA
jgi:plastocyanin